MGEVICIPGVSQRPKAEDLGVSPCRDEVPLFLMFTDKVQAFVMRLKLWEVKMGEKKIGMFLILDDRGLSNTLEQLAALILGPYSGQNKLQTCFPDLSEQ